MIVTSFTRSPARAFDESPGKARNRVNPRQAGTIVPCSQKSWWVQALAVCSKGGFLGLKNVGLYTTCVVEQHYVVMLDDFSLENRWERSTAVADTVIGDVKEYTLETSKNGVIRHWLRNDDGTVTETVAEGPFDGYNDLKYPVPSDYRLLSETDSESLTGSTMTASYPYKTIVDGSYMTVRLTGPVDYSSLITDAVGLCNSLPVTGSVDIVTGFDPWIETSCNLDLGGSDNTLGGLSQKFYCAYSTRTPVGMRTIKRSTPPDNLMNLRPVGTALPMDNNFPAAGTTAWGACSLGAPSLAGIPVSEDDVLLPFGVDWAGGPKLGDHAPGVVYALAGRYLLLTADNRCCEQQLKMMVGLGSDPAVNMTGILSVLKPATMFPVDDGCYQMTLATDPQTRGCTDGVDGFGNETLPCLYSVETWPSDADQLCGYMRHLCTYCDTSCSALGCAVEVTP